MAPDGRPEPPRTLAAWHRFQEECWRQQRYDWLPKEWEPSDFADQTRDDISEAVWFAAAQDHPFKGSSWCWRCLAEAHGAPCSHIPHVVREDAICWSPAERRTATEDGQQDRRPPGDESTSDWTEAGRQYVAEGFDTGTGFYVPPPKPTRQVFGATSVRITKLDAEGNPVGEPQDLSDFATAQFSPSDDESLPDFPVGKTLSVEIPISPDAVDAALQAIEQTRKPT